MPWRWNLRGVDVILWSLRRLPKVCIDDTYVFLRSFLRGARSVAARCALSALTGIVSSQECLVTNTISLFLYLPHTFIHSFRSETPGLAGTIYTVADEVEKLGAKALPFQLDVRDDKRIQEMIDLAAKELGAPTICVNNASALWWKSIEETESKNFDLIHAINARGTFALTRACLPYMRESKWGHVLTQSPPIDLSKMAGMTAYNMSKFGMTMVALGVAQEYPGIVAGNSMWPTTLIESAATVNHELGSPKHWRKADILVDAICEVFEESPSDPAHSGRMLLDEPFLRSKGVDDFSKYQCVPGHEPPKMDEVARLLMGAGGSAKGKYRGQ